MSLDTTIGGVTADSYCTMVQADAYHALSRAHNAEWASAAEADKERALRWAARQLDLLFRFVGTRATAEQARAWPRKTASDEDGYPLAEDAIPARVREAQAEFALQLLREDWTQGLGPTTDQGVKVGPIQTTAESHNPIPAAVLAIIGGLGVLVFKAPGGTDGDADSADWGSSEMGVG